MMTSRKFILFVSLSAVNLSLGCNVFKSFSVFWTFVWLVVDNQYVVYVSEIFYDLMFV